MLHKPAKSILSKALVIALCSSLTLASPGAALAASGDVGTPAPDFDLLIFQGGGTTQSLSALSGKVVMLDIIGYS